MRFVRVMVVEDDPEMGRLLERGLVAEGYDVTLVNNGVDALIAAANTEFAAAAIDVMLPGMTGFEICRHLREMKSRVPILLVTARDAVEDRVYGLDSGADDYLTKPFAFAELTARIRAMLRREAGAAHTTVTIGTLTVDSLAHRASVSGRELPLSPKEFALLRFFADNPGQVQSKVAILEELWGTAEHIDPNIVDQYVSYLRRKLGAASAAAQIVTERGAGYYLALREMESDSDGSGDSAASGADGAS